YPSFSDGFASGNAFLLITQDGSSFDVTNAESRPTDRPATGRLSPGWTLIGNPVAFPVALSEFGGDLSPVDGRAWFDGTEMIQSGAPVEVLQPWDGIFLHNGSLETISVQIAPIEAFQEDDVQESVRTESTAAAQLRLSASNGRYR